MNQSLPWVPIWIVFSIALTPQVRATQPLAPSSAENLIDEAVLRSHVAFLADDALAGRDSGTDGLRKAAAYSVKAFQEMGLEPFGDIDPETGKRDFFQRFSINTAPVLADDQNVITIHGPNGEERIDAGVVWLPFRFTANLAFERKDVVFVGYGVTDKDQDYDDYADIDVRGKVVLLLRYEPGEPGNDRYRPSSNAYLVTKARLALRNGAVGMILVNGPASNRPEGDDPLFGLGSAGRFKNDKATMLHIKRTLADKLFEKSGTTLLELQESIESSKKPNSRVLPGVKVSIQTRLERPKVETRNVVAYLPGTNPDGDVLVLGAHYDHVGLGHFGSTWGARGRGKIHNGADDNASGTSAVMAVARALSRSPRQERGVIFTLFAAEERGLLGSAHFVDNPPVALERITAMINADMIGRSDEGNLTIGGIATAKNFDDLVRSNNRGLDLELTLDPSGEAPSDHMRFYRKKIPVLFYFTGIHQQYHTPDDDIETINFKNLTRISRHIYRTAFALAGQGVEKL